MKKYFRILLSLLFIVLLQSCATTKKPVSVHGDKPLIDTAKIIVDGRVDMDKKVIDGPKPYDMVLPREDKRKTITTENVKTTSIFLMSILTLNKWLILIFKV